MAKATSSQTEVSRRWMRYPQAEEYSGLCRSKLQSLVVSGELPHARHNRTVVIDARDLDRTMEKLKKAGAETVKKMAEEKAGKA